MNAVRRLIALSAVGSFAVLTSLAAADTSDNGEFGSLRVTASLAHHAPEGQSEWILESTASTGMGPKHGAAGVGPARRLGDANGMERYRLRLSLASGSARASPWSLSQRHLGRTR